MVISWSRDGVLHVPGVWRVRELFSSTALMSPPSATMYYTIVSVSVWPHLDEHGRVEPSALVDVLQHGEVLLLLLEAGEQAAVVELATQVEGGAVHVLAHTAPLAALRLRHRHAHVRLTHDRHTGESSQKRLDCDGVLSM